MTLDTSNWSGEGGVTQVLVDFLQQLEDVAEVRVEDAPASRSEADYNFISNEVFVRFAMIPTQRREKKWGVIPVNRVVDVKKMTMDRLEAALVAAPEIGAPDYSDAGMLQYLRTERIIPPYQTRGYKLVELVRVYEAGTPRRE